jgi:ABC-type uncharacterized transport system substrate-binding protein
VGLSASSARSFVALALRMAAILAVPIAAHAQASGRVYRVGYLSGVGEATGRGSTDVFREALRDVGLVEGRNVVVEYRSAAGRPELLSDLAAELVRLRVDVIVAIVPAAVLAARQATTAIPIVMVHGPDPIQFGLVASIARPSGNITGLTTLSADVSAKQFELLKSLVPRVSRAAILSNPSNPWHPLAIRAIEATAKPLGVELVVASVRTAGDLEGAFATIVKQRAKAVLVLADPMTVFARARVAELALRQHLPTMGSVAEMADAGCLASYWPDGADLNRRAAAYVQKILAGARPGDLPIEQPTKYEFVVNLKTAKTLGLTIPPSMLVRADRVVE